MDERLISLCLFSSKLLPAAILLVFSLALFAVSAHLAAGRHGRSGSHGLSHAQSNDLPFDLSLLEGELQQGKP